MGNRVTWAFLLGVEAILWAVHSWLWATGWALFLGVVYLVSIKFFQFVPCPRCGGSHKIGEPALFRGAHRHCGRCKKKGEVIRWGVAVFRRRDARELESSGYVR